MGISKATDREYARILKRIEKRIAAGGARAGECETHCTSTRNAERAAVKAAAARFGRTDQLPQYLLDPIKPNPKQRFSKKKSLKYLPVDWREQLIVLARYTEYLFAITISISAGCRPKELKNGITVTDRDDGVEVAIIGAKVNDDHHAGQRERCLLLRRTAFTELMPRGNYVLDCAVDTYRKAVARMGEMITPDAPNKMTAYTMRHAFAASLKTAGVDPDDISMALGHRASKSRRRYGHGHGGRGISDSPLISVTATHPVRNVGGHPGERARSRMKAR